MLGPLPEPPGPARERRRLPVSDWPRSTQIAAGVASLLGVTVLILFLVVGAWRTHAERLAADRDAFSTEVERIEAELAELEGLPQELAAAERALEQAREAAEVAEEEAQEAAESELAERMAEVDAELEAAKEELAAANAALDEREAELTQAEETQARSTFGDGVHVVGQDIEPGTYRREGSGRCYWARLRGLSGDFGDIITNGTPQGPATVEIQASDAAFESSRCGQWTRR